MFTIVVSFINNLLIHSESLIFEQSVVLILPVRSFFLTVHIYVLLLCKFFYVHQGTTTLRYWTKGTKGSVVLRKSLNRYELQRLNRGGSERTR